jgi:hypothetical protein
MSGVVPTVTEDATVPPNATVVWPVTKSVPVTVTVGAQALLSSGALFGDTPVTVGGAWVNRPIWVPHRPWLVLLVEPYSSANQTSLALTGSRAAPE